MPDPSTNQKVVVELERDELEAAADALSGVPESDADPYWNARKKFKAALSAQDVQEEVTDDAC